MRLAKLFDTHEVFPREVEAGFLPEILALEETMLQPLVALIDERNFHPVHETADGKITYEVGARHSAINCPLTPHRRFSGSYS